MYQARIHPHLAPTTPRIQVRSSRKHSVTRCYFVPRRDLTALAFAVFFALLGVTMLIFRGLGRERALALGLMVCQRNMGLMVAATDGVLPGTTWLYFALSQFPIYLSPQLLKPVVQKLRARKAEAESGAAGKP
jgi:BASS family bile acid:Na+ symporter